MFLPFTSTLKMLNRSIFILIFILLQTLHLQQAKARININFSKTDTVMVFDHDSVFDHVIQKAKKAHKLIFVDAYTTWCGPCKWMAKNVFTNKEVADYYNAHFICAKIDMERGEGPAFAKKYSVRCYPNLLFIDENGKLVHRSAGTKVVKDFIAFGETALNNEQNFYHYQSAYKSSPNDGTAVLGYLGALNNTCLNALADSVLTAYFSKLDDKALMTANNWNLIKDYAHDINGREFKLVLRNLEAFNHLSTELEVKNWAESNFLSAAAGVLRMQGVQTDSALGAFKKNVVATGLNFKDEVIALTDLLILSRKKDWDGYEQKALAVVGKGKAVTNPSEINNIAWRLNDHTNNELTRKTAAEWMKGICEENKNQKDVWMYYDTYAVILNKLGNKAEAKQVAAKAIESAKKAGETEDNYASSTAILNQ